MDKFDTVAELIYYSYANLAMAHTAVDKGRKYSRFYEFFL